MWTIPTYIHTHTHTHTHTFCLETTPIRNLQFLFFYAKLLLIGLLSIQSQCCKNQFTIVNRNWLCLHSNNFAMFLNWTLFVTIFTCLNIFDLINVLLNTSSQLWTNISVTLNISNVQWDFENIFYSGKRMNFQPLRAQKLLNFSDWLEETIFMIGSPSSV